MNPRRPVKRPVPGLSSLKDVEHALDLARRFLFYGGDPEQVAEYIDAWLDYRLSIAGTSLELCRPTRELTPS